MSAEYEPGTVAIATVRGVPNVRVLRTASGCWFTGRYIDGWSVHNESEHVAEVRPLAVLDLGNSKPQTVANVLRMAAYDRLADQIEQQTRPPKPPEPKNRYAVVLDANGTEWLRDKHGTWCHTNHGTRWETREWTELDAVRVLSKGVS